MSPAEFIDNPNWASFLPETPEPRRRGLPDHSDCTPLDVASAAAFLSQGGALGAFAGYEERPGQLDMLKAVAGAFNDRSHLMIEAGTGVGKSLAYLIPSLLWAAANDTTVVVSTATRNLQSQLIGSDIPRALSLLGDRVANVRVALLKGRGNYLCLRALAEFFAAGFWTMSAEEQAEMPHLIDWLRTTPDGDLDRYEGLPRALLTCPGEECGGRRCPYYSRCFVYRARKAAAAAHLVVANHALVLAEATCPESGFFPAYGCLVLDEAHNLEDIATDCFSHVFSLPDLSRLLNRLRRRGRGRRVRPGGVLAAVERQLSRGVLADSPAVATVSRLLDEAGPLTVQLVKAAEAIARVAAAKLLDVAPAADLVGARPRRYRSDWLPTADRLALQKVFDSAMARLVGCLHDLSDALDGSVPAGEFNFCADLVVQLRGVASSLVMFANETDFVLRADSAEFAYWAERKPGERKGGDLRLVGAPLAVADDLRRHLYDQKDAVVLCSATLRIGPDFGYMSRRLGFLPAETPAEEGEPQPDRYRRLFASSPFDYLRQSLTLAADFLPNPATDSGPFVAALAQMLEEIFAVTEGRGLVLFTSYEMMQAVAAAVSDRFAAAGFTLLVQGDGMGREAMAERLRTAGDRGERVVLFGAQSFWEGVDVVGAALSCVVIARLPFAQQGDPIVEARSEQIARTGKSPFRDYALPEAVIRFRQGVGRLIRAKRDRGVVIVADPRLATKNYGGIFRRSVPGTVHTVSDRGELLQRVSSWFDEQGEKR